MQRVALFCALAFLLMLPGCQSENAGEVSPEAKLAETVTDEKSGEDKPVDAESVDAESVESKDAYWQEISNLYEQVKASGQTTTESASEWISEFYQQSKQASIESADGATKRVQALYENAKKRGETTATSAKDWVLDDLNRIGAWQYKTLVVSNEEPGDVARKLNKLGAERWECFHVDRDELQATFYFKKSARSYLRQLPAKELLRLLPLIGAGVGGSNE